jgi:hypothetical protein
MFSTVSCDVISTMYFLKSIDLYETVKPYHLDFEPERNIPRTNVQKEEVHDVEITDLRGKETAFNFTTNGFMILRLEDSNALSQWDNENFVKTVYYKEMERQLALQFHGSQCIALSHQV